MLRLPKFALEEPTTLDAALTLLRDEPTARVIAGGTDLVPNMKHQLFEPKLVISLAQIEELRGIRADDDGAVTIGAMTRLDEVAQSSELACRTPALQQAASLIAGPQLRSMGTLGGNVMLDTRCQWYNQTYFWRKALGFCLKKDGTVCHVVQGGQKCVAAASNDSAPALMTLGAKLVFANAGGTRELAIDELWKGDGIFNKVAERDEILTRIRIPARTRHVGAYGKLRDRGSIDFPLLGVAVRLDVDEHSAVTDADVVTVALAARPVRVKRAALDLIGSKLGSPEFERAVEAVAELAHKQCKPLPNIPGDHEYRRAMVPVYVRRTLLAAAQGTGPVHHI